MKKRWKKGIALGMALVMCVSMAGCSSSKKETKSKTAKQTTEKQSDYGYQVDYTSLDFLQSKDENHEVWLSNDMQEYQGKLYFSAGYHSDDTVTTKLQSITVGSEEEPVTYVTLTDADNTSSSIGAICPDEDGSISFLKQIYTFSDVYDSDIIDEPDEHNLSEKVTEEYLEANDIDLDSVGLEFNDVKDLNIAEFNKLYAQLSGEEPNGDEEPSEDEVAIESMKTFMVTVDNEGKELSSEDISDQLGDSYLYDGILCDGIYYVKETEYSDDFEDVTTYIYELDFKNKKCEKNLIEENDELNYLVSTGNGDLVGIFSTDDGMILKNFDKEKKSFKKIKDSELTGYWVDGCGTASDDNFYYLCDGSMYLYDIKKNKDTELVTFRDWDVSGDDYNLVSFKDEKHFTILTNAYSFDGNREYLLNTFTQVPMSEIPERTEITLGYFESSDSLDRVIVNFNRNHTDYRIKTKQYFNWEEDDDGDGYEKALKKFDDDIISGKGADILLFNYGGDLATYAKLGALEDLHTYMDKDEDFSKKEFQENVLKLFENDGKLCILPTSYSIFGLASAKELLGDEPLTLTKFEEILKANPDKEPFNMSSRESILEILFSYNRDYFVDDENKTCKFDDGQFETLLKIAASFPSQEEIEAAYDDDTYESEEKRIHDGKQMFYAMSLHNFDEYSVASTLINSDINVTGYPTVKGDSMSISVSGNAYAINSNSKYKEICWEFIKECYEQNLEELDMYGGFSVEKTQFEEQLKKAMTQETYTDKNGNEIPSDNTYSYDDFEISIQPLTEAQAENIRSLVKSVNNLLNTGIASDEISGIITEEAQAYFDGKKSAKEIADVVQSRVNIYINEDN